MEERKREKEGIHGKIWIPGYANVCQGPALQSLYW